jgi:hypothetical protein
MPPESPEPISVSDSSATTLPADPAFEPTEPTELTEHRPRRTVIGLAVGITQSESPPAPVIEELAPIEHWTLPPSAMPLPGATLPPDTALPHELVIPSGNWAIARDPYAPDGWSEPFATMSPGELNRALGHEPGREASGAPAHHPAPDPSAHPALPETAAWYSAPPIDPVAVAEPKVQVDPSLVDPSGAPLGSPSGMQPGFPPDMSLYGAQVGYPNPYAMHDPRAMHQGEAPAYAVAPAHQMVGIASLPPPTAIINRPSAPYDASQSMMPVPLGRRRAAIVIASAIVAVAIGVIVLMALAERSESGAPADGPAHGRAPAAEALPSAIVVNSPTGAAATAGRLGSTAPATTAPATTAPATTAPATTAPATTAPATTAPATTAPATTTPATTAPATTAPATTAPATTAPATTAGPPAAASSTGAAPSAPLEQASGCFAEVSSVPAGAEIVIDESNVIGLTPQRVALPCGHPVDLVIRKARLVPVTRTITPGPRGMKLKVALTKQTFQVRVSSNPEGAMVTLNGRALGVTPTTVRVPVFELSTLTITKDGYETETQKVAPKANGSALHAQLKRLDR